MVKEKKGKALTFSRINKRLLLNYPGAVSSIPLARRIFQHTMLSFSALYQLRKHLEDLNRGGIRGSIVETGCWKGGCGAFMTRLTKDDGSLRPVWLFDSFEGLPELTTEDSEWAERLDVSVVSQGSSAEIKPIGLYKATEHDVREALLRAGVSASDSRVHIVKGWFQNSVPTVIHEVGSIALLRLDGDTYDSTKYCLEALHGSVVKGGYVVIDDFNLRGCRQAIFEFFADRNEYPEIQRFPFGGRVYWRKE